MNSKYRYLVPNGVTLVALACGIASILASATGSLSWAGTLILISYFVDFLDGALARRLKAGSDFGVQLDSLADMVSLGTAPAILAFAYLQMQGFQGVWLVLFVMLFPLAGAFRLARFNLLPPKTGRSDSIGLTISTAGAMLTLAILSNIAAAGSFFPDRILFPLILGLSLLMISHIQFPSTHAVFCRNKVNVLYLCFLGTLLVVFQLPLPHTFFLFTGGYVGFGVARAGYKVIGS
jgi:CDP-diacylglycerol---serine O-phosphatidyltransferase